MSDDALARAARALRESRQGDSPGAANTRTRILESALLQRRRRRRAALVLLPLAATFVLSTAWAAAIGHLPALTTWLGRAPRAVEPPPVAPFRALASPEEPTATAPIAAAHDALNSQPSPPPPEPSTEAAPPPPVPLPVPPRTRPPPVQTATPATPITPAAPATAIPTTDAEGSLYAEAHAAHFVARDPAAALRAWDAYLATYPDGRLALEARYNRALTLVRLGRATEARAALAPFAQGPAGGYRQREARALLDALDARP